MTVGGFTCEMWRKSYAGGKYLYLRNPLDHNRLCFAVEFGKWSLYIGRTA